jgi:hypothetical protein
MRKTKNFEILKIIKKDIKYIKILCFCFIISTNNLLAQNYDSLNNLKDYKTKVFCSAGTEERAKLMATRCDKVLTYFKKHIKYEPSVTLLILSPLDWGKYASSVVYGMPHYNANSKSLIVASEDNAFWKSFIPPIDKLPKELSEQITATYSDKKGNLTMQAFFDLLAIHELGHAYHMQNKLKMQRIWMGELFANILLHSYIAENEPQLLPALTVFPKMVVSGGKAGLKYTSLFDLENNYGEISQKYPQNYGWYQCKWHSAAENIYNLGGVKAFKKLWRALKMQKEILDDEKFVTLLSKKTHQSIANVQLEWDK